MPAVCPMPRISEDPRNWLWREFGAALDRSCYIVARVHREEAEGIRFIRGLDNRLMLDVEQREFFELDYPVLTHALGLHDRDTYKSLGASLSCAREAPLGRAVSLLQRRVRFRHTARRFLKRLLEQLPCSNQETNRHIIVYIGGVTLHPRVM